MKTTTLDTQNKSLVKTYVTLQLVAAYFYSMSTTFLSLHIIDQVGFSRAGKILSLLFLVSAVTDYPTGVLSDYIGHRFVLLIAYFSFAISYLGLALFSSPIFLSISIIFFALGQAQRSGTLDSWLDAKYNERDESIDPEKKIYGEFLGNFEKYRGYTGGLAIITGGILATILPSGRRIVFSIQVVAHIIIALWMFVTVDTIEVQQKEKDEEKSYASKMGDSLKFIFGNKVPFLYSFGLIISIAFTNVRYWLIIFVLYFGYTGSDMGAAILRFSLFFAVSYIAGFAAKTSKNVTLKKGYIISSVMGFLLYNVPILLLVLIIPVNNTFNLIGIITIFIFVLASNFFTTIVMILERKINLELVPDKIRNSFYSFSPTFGQLISIPLITVVGSLIDKFSLFEGIATIAGFEIIAILFLIVAITMYVNKSDFSNKTLENE